MNIPFNQVQLTEDEIYIMKNALKNGFISGNGPYTKKVETFMHFNFNCPYSFMMHSGSQALEMAMLLIDLKPGDEVILPSFTFPATANAILLRGAQPVFVDINPETLTISIAEIEKNINTRTKAIVPVHYGGISCDMDPIMSIAHKHNLYVIEDAAQSINAKYKNRFSGTIGHLGCYSFHSTKNLTSGEGGALIVNDETLLSKAEKIYFNGTNKLDFLRGEVDYYTWVEVGSSCPPSDLLMALLYRQLKKVTFFESQRKTYFENYFNFSLKYIDQGIIESMSHIPQNYKSNYHLFYWILKNQDIRTELIAKLKAKNISAHTHYMPLHQSLMYKKLGLPPIHLPITESISETLIRLPLYNTMRPEENAYVIESLDSIMKVF